MIDKDKRAEYDFFLKTINEFHNNVDEWDEYFDKKTFNIYKTIRIFRSDAINGVTRRIKFDEIGKTFDVVIPKGTVSKQVIKLKDQGKLDGETKRRGDILITVIVVLDRNEANRKENVSNESSRKADDKYNVHEVVHIDYEQAKDGVTVKLDLPSRKVDVKISPNTKDGNVIRMKGFGRYDKKNKVYGDLFVTVLVANPLPEIFVSSGVVIAMIIVFCLLALAFGNSNDTYSNKYDINPINNEQKKEQEPVKTNSNVTNNVTPKKEVTVDPNPFKGFSGGYASNKDGIYNYIKVFPENTTIYAAPYQSITFTFKGYNKDVDINGQVYVKTGEFYYGRYVNDSNGRTQQTSFYFMNPGTYTVQASMNDSLGGWTGRTYTVVVNNSNVKNDVYRDVYYLP